jgi:DNA-binding response OmpR family regulator
MTSEHPTILLVEDDDFAAELTMEMLAADYAVRRFDNGQAALDALTELAPDLVLLDVSMPGLSGYEVCRALRDDPTVGDLPVIFLSGMVSEEERLAGYEAGGDDYLTKPVTARELRSKISLALGRYVERQRLKSDFSNAFSTAMTAMSSAAEIGTVLQFLRTSFNSPDYTALCREVLNTLGLYGIEGSIQIRGRQGTVSYAAEGSCSPLEESVLSNMSKQGRLFEFGSRISCSYDHVTIIAKSMPRDDADRHGRMKDNLALLAEGADARVVALDSGAALVKQQKTLMQLITNTRETLHEIEQLRLSQHTESSRILQDFRSQLERLFLSLGLTQSQEEELAELAQQAANRALALYDQGVAVEERMKNLLQQLDSAGGD